MPDYQYTLPSRRLVSQEDAARIQNANVPRSRFTNAWTAKTTFDAGYLIPFVVNEALPGDHFRYDVTAYIRLATPLFPIFDNQRIDTFFFFVPNRLVWTNWVKMMGEQAAPGDSIDFSVPIIQSPVAGFPVNTIYDQMDVPGVGQITATEFTQISALPLRAYNLIWNTWFRDQNIQSPAVVATGNGPDPYTDYVLKKRAKAHDYFTTALPWPQKFTSPFVPLTGAAPIQGLGFQNIGPAGAPANFTEAARGAGVLYTNWAGIISPGGATSPTDMTGSGQVIGMQLSGSNIPAVVADLSQATGFAINAFRQAFMVQSLIERDARGGTRYVELIRSHFGVTNPDFRLQRPEYIGGGSTPLVITPIAQTAPTTGVPLGALGAAGTAAGTHRASYAATEHGYIIGLINVRSEVSYQQGLPKHFSRRTRYDYYWPSLAALGEQAILRQEIYQTGVAADDATVFGYQERWHEYRTEVSRVRGMFRSTTASTIDAWHLAEVFASAPTLNNTFISDQTPMERVLAAGASANNQQYLADILVRRDAVRPIPAYGTPATLGRF